MGKRLASMSKALTGSVVDVVIDNQGGNVLLNSINAIRIFFMTYIIFISLSLIYRLYKQ
jgi:hypothetical protein